MDFSQDNRLKNDRIATRKYTLTALVNKVSFSYQWKPNRLIYQALIDVERHCRWSSSAEKRWIQSNFVEGDKITLKKAGRSLSLEEKPRRTIRHYGNKQCQKVLRQNNNISLLIKTHAYDSKQSNRAQHWSSQRSFKERRRNRQVKQHNLDLNSKYFISDTETYYIDTNGYLLDKNKYYLLNQKNEQIRLTDKEIDLLKKHNILWGILWFFVYSIFLLILQGKGFPAYFYFKHEWRLVVHPSLSDFL